MIGKRLSPILTELEATLWEFEAMYPGEKPEYTPDGSRAVIKLLMSVVMDKSWELMEAEKIPQHIREDMAHKCGTEFRELIKKYTNLDTHKMYG
jgi:hypothetical protein